jgi:steroid 5-alpha reductase family enzyme
VRTTLGEEYNMPENDPLVEKKEGDDPKGLIGALIFIGIGVGFGAATSTLEEVAVAYGVNLASFLLVAYPLKTEKYYDFTGMIAFLSTVWFSVIYRLPRLDSEFATRSLVVSAMVSCWTLNLGTFLFKRILSHGGRDARFDDLRENFCKFSAYWMGQGAWVYLNAFPLWIINSVSNPDVQKPADAITALDIVGWSMWVLGWGCELLGDRQKSAFKADPANRGKFCNVGLWSITRHPNYFGEILLWLGITVSALSVAHKLGFLLFVSPVYVLFLMVFASGIPVGEAAALKKYGRTEGYLDYINSVPVLIPFFFCWTSWPGKQKAMADAGLS